MNTAGLQTVFVVHVNHPNELDQEVYEALTRLTGAGARLFNQSVLLKDPRVVDVPACAVDEVQIVSDFDETNASLDQSST